MIEILNQEVYNEEVPQICCRSGWTCRPDCDGVNFTAPWIDRLGAHDKWIAASLLDDESAIDRLFAITIAGGKVPRLWHTSVDIQRMRLPWKMNMGLDGK